MKEKGQILVLAMIVLGIVFLNVILLAGGSMNFFQNANQTVRSTQALHLAEAGIDKALAALNSTAGEYSGESDTSLGAGTFSVSVTTVDANTKQVESTGYIPSRQNSKAKKTIRMTVAKGVGASFNYGVQVGDGGLSMGENSVIEGSVFSNGAVTMANNSQITGDVYVASGISPTAQLEVDCTPPNCQDFLFGRSIGGQDRLDVAQSFRPATAYTLSKVALKLKKFGSPSDITVRILGDDLGKPDKNNVLAQGTMWASQVTSEYGFLEVILSPELSLQADTLYWLLVDTSSDNNNYWFWSADSMQSYSGGNSFFTANWQSGTAVWTDTGFDLGFKIFSGGIPSGVTGGSGVRIGKDAHAHLLKDLNINKGAYYQVAENIQAASYHPGAADPVAQSMPLSANNILQWKNTAASLGTFSGDITTCPDTLAAGKYLGSITLPGSCTVVVGTPIWVTGNFTLANNDTLRLGSSYGPTSGVVMVDNFIQFGNGNRLLGSGESGSYLLLLSEFNSSNDPELRAAITFQNSGNNGIVYARLGIIRVANNNDLKEVMGWKLELGNGVRVTYEQGLANIFFSSGPSGSFSLVSGTYQLR